MQRARLIALLILLPPLYAHAAPQQGRINSYNQKLNAGKPAPALVQQPAKPVRPTVHYEKVVQTAPQFVAHPRPTTGFRPRPYSPKPACQKRDVEEDELGITRFNPCLNKISSLVSDIDSKVGALDSLIDTLDACDSTPLFGPGPITIASPGNYCLAQNVSTITISASKVNLNLNGYIVSSTTAGITINGVNPADITIRNGIVQATNNASGTGINIVSGGSGISILNVTVENWSTGVLAEDVTNLLVQDCSLFNNNSVGLQIADDINVEIRDCSFSANSTGLLVADVDSTSKGIKILNCAFNQTQTALGSAVDITTGESIEIIGCSAIGQASQTSGFAISGNLAPATNSVLIENCFASDFSDNSLGAGNGFLIDAVNGICISNCTAEDNFTGFNITTGSIAIVRDSVAANNSTGFNWDGTGNAQFYANQACGNSTLNYSATITSAPVTSPANARGVHNVDCSNSDLDQVAVIESSLDGMSSSSEVDSISSKLSVVESKTDECCTVENSKLDNISSKIDSHSLCAAIPITGPGSLSTYGGSKSGVYCLTTDLTSTLTIDVSNVTVDLNGHNIFTTTTGIFIGGGVSNVIIQNGTIVSDGTGTAGIKRGGTPSPVSVIQIELRNLIIDSWVSGIDLTGGIGASSNNNYHDLLVTNCTGTGITITGFEHILRNNQITFNDTGITSTAHQVLIDNCTVDSNNTTGINLGISSPFVGLGAQIINSSANANTTGIQLNGTKNIEISQSTINSNTTGINMTGGTQFTTISNATINDNTAGIIVDGGSQATIGQTSFENNSNSVTVTNNASKISFSECSFHGGAPVVVRNSGQIQFNNCTTTTTAVNGFEASGSSKIVIQDCSVINDNTTGADYSMADIIDLYIARSIAQGGDTGFALMGNVAGSIINGCTAAGASICGFDAVSTTSASFIGNIGKRNGTTPAGSPDTNYCLSEAGSTFTPPDGPGPAPYYQTSPLVATSAWRNLTLPM